MNSKLLSGRLWLTVISGLVFAYCACKKILPPEATAAILGTVFTAYFTRNDRRAAVDSNLTASTTSVSTTSTTPPPRALPAA